MQCIGATTLDEYRKHIEKDPTLERRFQPIKVLEPTVDETIHIYGSTTYPLSFPVILNFEYDTSVCPHFSDRFLPDKVINLLIDEAGSQVRLGHAQ
ncbi:ATP-dependent Clp protease ATP-binding subunit ClpC1, partial [Sarracenia purpurea var. burkii]